MASDSHMKNYACPKCGKTHAADLSAMEGRPEIHGKVHCMKCHALLRLSLESDGTVSVEAVEEAATPAGKTAAKAPEQAPALRGVFIPVLIAAVVAAGVGFLVAGATEKKAPQTQDTEARAAAEKLQLQVDGLRTRLDTAVSDAGAANENLQKAVAELQAALQRNAETLQAVPTTDYGDKLAALEARVVELATSCKNLRGRIEGNYNAFRLIKKRLDEGGGN